MVISSSAAVDGSPPSSYARREFRLLCLCCAGRLDGSRADALRAIAAQGVDWSVVLRLVKRHRVAGLVFSQLNLAGIKAPSPFCSELAVLALKIRLDNQRSAAESVRIQQRLDAAGINARFFKGAALAQLAYGSLEIKHSKDIDVLVAPQDVPALVRILEDDGYKMWLPAHKVNDKHWSALLRFAHEFAMIRPGTNLQVEPHWKLTHNPRLLPHLDVNAQPTTIELPGYGSIRTFHRSDMFAYLCVHGLMHGWVRLKWLADLNAFIEDCGPSDLAELYDYAVRHDVGPSAAIALSLCEELFGTVAPRDAHRMLEKSFGNRKLKQLALSCITGDAERVGWRRATAMNLLTAATHGHFWSQFLRTWVATADIIQVPLQRPLHGIYVLLRIPFGIARKIRFRSSDEYHPLPTMSSPSLPTVPPAR